MQKRIPLFLVFALFSTYCMAQCNAGFTYSVSQSEVHFTSTGINATQPVHNLWIFGDGSANSDMANPVHVYNHAGTYNVLHVVTDSLHTCSDSVMHTVTITDTVPPPPPPSCNAGFTVSISHNEVHFYSAIASLHNHHTWIFGDGSSNSDMINPVHVYSLPGTYNVLHVFRDSLNTCVDSVMQTIRINADSTSCDASFTYTASHDTVSFHASQNNTHTHHLWVFGDGSSNSDQVNPTHPYSHGGQFTVLHVIRDTTSNCVDSVYQVINLPVTADTCSVNISYDGPSATSSAYTFHVQVSVPGSTLQSIHWTINGTVVSEHDGLSYTFTQAGTYEVCVNIQSAAGCTAHKCVTINFQPNTDTCNLHGSFGWHQDATHPGQINFEGQPNLPQLKYNWTFGDGTEGHGRIVSHHYNGAGVYHVRMVVIDTFHNCRDSVVQNVTVTGSPADSCTASFTYTANDHGEVHFTAVSNQVIVSQYWYISTATDSIVLTTTNPTYTFTDTGRYYVCLVIHTATGCVRTHCDYIHVLHAGRTGRLVPSYPNPVTTEPSIRVNVVLQADSRITYKVSNLAGNVVYQAQKQGYAGINVISIPVQQLPRGQYFIEISFGSEKRKSVFQKL